MAGESVTVSVEVWVVVDENGDYYIAKEEGDLDGSDLSLIARVFCVTLKLPTPKPMLLAATIPEEKGGGELKIVEVPQE